MKIIYLRLHNTGKINEIIHHHTVSYNAWSRLYLSLTDLLYLLEQIIRSNNTTTSISIVPFYRSEARGGFQEAFDIGRFYIECRRQSNGCRKRHCEKRG